MRPSITPAGLQAALDSVAPPLVIDVRRRDRFRDGADLIGGALWRDPLRVRDWAKEMPSGAAVVVYCVHGRDVSQGTADALVAAGIATSFLEGGIESWRAVQGALDRKPVGGPTRWVTRERPKIDRIACPWLIHRFIDPEAEFYYVPAGDVRRVAAERDATAYDIPDVRFSHDGDQCSFDAFLGAYRLHDPALDALAVIVRGADTGRLALTPEAAGLAAISLGLSRLYPDDHAMLAHGMVMYDALHRWCREGKDEVHTWNPEAYR